MPAHKQTHNEWPNPPVLQGVQELCPNSRVCLAFVTRTGVTHLTYASGFFQDNTPNALKVDNKQNVEPQLTEFEKQRNAQIERNRKVLNSLKLPTMDSWSKPLNRFAPKKKPKKPLPLPPASRKSLRQQGKAPDGSRPADGNEENASPKVASLSDPTASKPRHNMELIGFESLNGGATSDAEFLKVLARGGGPSRGHKEGLSAAGLWALTLREEDVGKVTRAAAVVMGFQDRHDDLVVAGGDKLGHVGLWRIGPDGQKGQQREEGTDIGGLFFCYFNLI